MAKFCEKCGHCIHCNPHTGNNVYNFGGKDWCEDCKWCTQSESEEYFR